MTKLKSHKVNPKFKNVKKAKEHSNKSSKIVPGCMEMTEFAEVEQVFLPPELGNLATWNTLALNPSAASIEMVNQEGPLLVFSLPPPLLLLRILAAEGCKISPVSGLLLCSLDFSKMDNKLLMTHSRVPEW